MKKEEKESLCLFHLFYINSVTVVVIYLLFGLGICSVQETKHKNQSHEFLFLASRKRNNQKNDTNTEKQIIFLIPELLVSDYVNILFGIDDKTCFLPFNFYLLAKIYFYLPTHNKIQGQDHLPFASISLICKSKLLHA